MRPVFGKFLVLLCLSFAQAASAATYYVAPNGVERLSTDASAPGSLRNAVANAPSGSTVILEDGSYDGAPDGFTVVHSSVAFRARNWHGAVVKNSTGENLWGPDRKLKPTGDVCQGIVFGPCVTPTSGGYSGGGGGG